MSTTLKSDGHAKVDALDRELRRQQHSATERQRFELSLMREELHQPDGLTEVGTILLRALVTGLREMIANPEVWHRGADEMPRLAGGLTWSRAMDVVEVLSARQ